MGGGIGKHMDPRRTIMRGEHSQPQPTIKSVHEGAASGLTADVDHHQAELTTDGVTVFPGVITAPQLASMRRVIDHYLEQPPSAYTHPDRIRGVNLMSWHPVFGQVATHPLLLRTVERILGDDCVLSSCNFAARRQGGGRQVLHRDTQIWGPSMPFMPFPVGIQTAWCIDDFTTDNGATHIVPGSHVIASLSANPGEIQVVAPAGSVIAYDAQTFHSGGSNQTPCLRRAVFAFYIRSWLKPQADLKRSFPASEVNLASPQLQRLLGFQRQAPIELRDGTQIFVDSPHATNFYGEPLHLSGS